MIKKLVKMGVFCLIKHGFDAIILQAVTMPIAGIWQPLACAMLVSQVRVLPSPPYFKKCVSFCGFSIPKSSILPVVVNCKLHSFVCLYAVGCYAILIYVRYENKSLHVLPVFQNRIRPRNVVRVRCCGASVYAVHLRGRFLHLSRDFSGTHDCEFPVPQCAVPFPVLLQFQTERLSRLFPRDSEQRRFGQLRFRSDIVVEYKTERFFKLP